MRVFKNGELWLTLPIPASRVLGRRLRFLQQGEEGSERHQVGATMEPADGDVHRVDGPTAELGDEVVPQLLQAQQRCDPIRMVPCDVDARRVAEEVGSVQEGDVEDMALDPLAAVEEAAELAHHGIDLEPERLLDRVDGTHLVGDRADAADPSRQVDGLVEPAADEEGLEEPGRLVDLEPDVGQHAILDHDVHGPFALDSRERRHVEIDVSVVHGRAFPSPIRSNGAGPLSHRSRSVSSSPKARACWVSATRLGLSAGPKHP